MNCNTAFSFVAYYLELYSTVSMQGNVSTERTEEFRSLDAEALQGNMSQIEMTRIFLTIISGLIVGIAHLEGASGFLAYLLLQMLTSLAIWAVCMQGDSQKFTGMSLVGFVFGSMGNHVLSFMLFWTLSHALVYIY